jgi:hypothetical protein
MCTVYGAIRVASRGQEIVSVASRGDLLNCISCVLKWPFELYQLRPEVTFWIVSVASQADRCKGISCVPSWPLQVYQLRPKLTAASVSVASRGDRWKCISCVPRLDRNCISCVQRYGCKKCQTIGTFFQFCCTLYTVICTRTELLNDTDSTQLLCYVTV